MQICLLSVFTSSFTEKKLVMWKYYICFEAIQICKIGAFRKPFEIKEMIFQYRQ